jgi:hypothetical protein
VAGLEQPGVDQLVEVEGRDRRSGSLSVLMTASRSAGSGTMMPPIVAEVRRVACSRRRTVDQ